MPATVYMHLIQQRTRETKIPRCHKLLLLRIFTWPSDECPVLFPAGGASSDPIKYGSRFRVYGQKAHLMWSSTALREVQKKLNYSSPSVENECLSFTLTSKDNFQMSSYNKIPKGGNILEENIVVAAEARHRVLQKGVCWLRTKSRDSCCGPTSWQTREKRQFSWVNSQFL